MLCGNSSLELLETPSYQVDQSRASSNDSSFASASVTIITAPAQLEINAAKVIPRVNKTLTMLKLSSLNSSHKSPEISVEESCDLCAICLSEIQSENVDCTITECCDHKFHGQCISRWKKEQTRCPLCRAGLSESQGENGMIQEFSFLENLRLIICWLTREN